MCRKVSIIAVIVLVNIVASVMLQCHLDTTPTASEYAVPATHPHPSPTHAFPHVHCLIAVLPGVLLLTSLLFQRFCPTLHVSALPDHPLPLFRPPPGTIAVLRGI